MAVKQLMDVLKNIGLEERVMELIQDRIQAKTKTPDKPHFEVVAEWERKTRCAESHAVEL